MIPDMSIVTDAVKQNDGLSVLIPPLNIMQLYVVYINEFICGLIPHYRILRFIFSELFGKGYLNAFIREMKTIIFVFPNDNFMFFFLLSSRQSLLSEG